MEVIVGYGWHRHWHRQTQIDTDDADDTDLGERRAHNPLVFTYNTDRGGRQDQQHLLSLSRLYIQYSKPIVIQKESVHTWLFL